ncbi:MAG: DNA-processing protein DprA [Planctomycetaceae bacterium]
MMSTTDPDSLTHPPTDQLHAALTVCLMPGVGPRLQAALLERFGTPECVLQQNVESLLSVDGIGRQIANRMVSPIHAAAATEMLQRCQSLGVTLLQKGRAPYPTGLQQVADSPLLLFCRGDIQPTDELAVAIVGSRRCTAYGRRTAQRLAGSLARAGFTIVSGLARGIDAAAHRGALEAGGRTLAVMATGVKTIYPPEHAELAVEITKQGALVSEFPLDTQPRPGLFPQRNRIISGLSLGVIVVEANRSSGALYTARHAFEQGREVFALPGQIDSLASEGCHDLIRDGATLIRHVDDVLEELGPLSTPATTAESLTVHDPRELALNPQEKDVLNLISTSPISIDELIRTSELPMARVLSTLTVLEMKRFVRRLPGSMLVRNS